MSGMTLLTVVDQVCGELGLAQPTIVIGNTNNQTMQMLALVNRLGKDLLREFEWQRLTKAYVFQTTAATTTTGSTDNGVEIIYNLALNTSGYAEVGTVVSGSSISAYTEVILPMTGSQVTLTTRATKGLIGGSFTFAKQDYAVPFDFDRMVSETNWDRTNHWRNMGSKSSQEWQWLQGGLISVGPRYRYRIYDNKVRLFPAPTTVMNIAYEYVSRYWTVAFGYSSGTGDRCVADSDTFVFPDELMYAGLKLYFLKAKKFDFGAELAEFNRALSNAKATDVPVPSMSLAPIQLPELIGPWSIPDGSWPTSS